MLLLPSQALFLTLFSDESAELQKSKTIEPFSALTQFHIIEMDRLLQLGRGGPGMGAAGQGTVVNKSFTFNRECSIKRPPSTTLLNRSTYRVWHC